MRDSRKAKSYVPAVYDGVLEMDEIVKTGDTLLDRAETQISSLIDNQWISVANEEGIKEWEDTLNIIADSMSEDIEFRRNRIINRLSSRIPFTEKALRKKLDAIIGVGNYILTIDNNNYIIYLESSATNQSWHTETLLTVNNMKPCNMVFMSTPLLNAGINAEEVIDYTQIIYNYTLGSGFQLGMRPFTTHINEVVVKLANSSSITDKFISSIATFAADDITSVLINDSIRVSSFEAKSSEGGKIIVMYNITSDQASNITNIKLLNANGDVLSSAAVYVPVSGSVRMKHTILVKEG